MKPHIPEEYIQIDELPWAPFPEGLSDGGIRWKLLHVSPEMGSWTAYFDCPEGSSFAPHIHMGPGEYFLTKGRMEVRGQTAVAPGYGYESCNAQHDKTFFPIHSEFYMTFLGPLQFIDADDAPVAVISWEQVQGAWAEANQQAAAE
jgi:hypothetical protein